MQSSQFQPITFVAMLADLNERLGTEKVHHLYHKKTSINIEHLIDILEKHALIAVKTRFQKADKTKSGAGSLF